jgi:acyl-CoA thioesterase-1
LRHYYPRKENDTMKHSVAIGALGFLILGAAWGANVADTDSESADKKPAAQERKAKRAAKKENPATKPIVDDPNLPRALLLGDSISMGYTLPTRKLLAGKANLHRAPENCGETRKALENLDKWLGEGKWDVIHFNSGLHDLKYALGETPEKGDSNNVPLEEYEKNFEQIVTRLEETGAKLIFATTTPYPEGLSPPRVPEDAVRYNEAALRVMKSHGVAINDLYAFALPQLETIQRPENVHFLPEGSEALAEQVASSIRKALEDSAGDQ